MFLFTRTFPEFLFRAQITISISKVRYFTRVSPESSWLHQYVVLLKECFSFCELVVLLFCVFFGITSAAFCNFSRLFLLCNFTQSFHQGQWLGEQGGPNCICRIQIMINHYCAYSDLFHTFMDDTEETPRKNLVVVPLCQNSSVCVSWWICLVPTKANINCHRLKLQSWLG